MIAATTLAFLAICAATVVELGQRGRHKAAITLVVVIAAGALVADEAAATNITLSWILPTTNTDGDALKPGELKSILGTCNAQSKAWAGTASSGKMDVPPGAYDCVVVAVNNQGSSSKPSSTKSIIVPDTTQEHPEAITHTTLFWPTGKSFTLQWDLPTETPAEWRLKLNKPRDEIVAQGTSKTGRLTLTLPRTGHYIFEYWHSQKNRWYGSYDWDNKILVNGWADTRHWWLYGYLQKPTATIK